MAKSDVGKGYRLKNIVIASVMLAAGLGCLAASELAWMEKHHFVEGLLTKFAEVIIVGGILGLGFEFALRRELIEQFESLLHSATKDMGDLLSKTEKRQNAIDNHMDHLLGALEIKLGIAEGMRTLGLLDVCPRENSYNYSEVILKSKRLTFVFNDGRTWFSTHASDMADRLSAPGLITNVVLVHPESPYIESLALKVDQTAEELVAKIEQSARQISRLHTADHELNIWGHFLPTSYSLVMSEDRAVYMPYSMARQEKITAYIFKSGVKGGFYESLRRDVDALIGDCRKVYPADLGLISANFPKALLPKSNNPHL